MKIKRILWLLNHDTLSKFELPLIKDMGFEIFTPKSTIKEILLASGSITFDYDDTLTIPIEDLKLLNEYDFFSTTNMPLYIRKIINKHFATAITYTDTSFLLLKKLIHNFEGNILFRAFGVGPSTFKNYTELINFYFSENDHFKLKQIRNRFWFSQCYSNIADIEEKFYQDNSVFMPLGLPKEFYNIENQWTGEIDKILFFCTRIKYSSESEKIYRQFKRDFSKFDYVIAGNQPVPVNDENVTGYLERDELNDLYKKCKVMYYHSTNPRHLHYHPLEAMITGMPVIYMEGGLLSILAGGNRQSGCCKNISEARKKIKQILNGDTQLIEDIKLDQKQILYKFSYEYNKLEWEKNFLPIIDNSIIAENETPIKIALFITDNQLSIYKNEYIQLASILNSGLKKNNSKQSLLFNILSDQMDINLDFSYLIHEGISVREFILNNISLKNITESLSLLYKNESLWYDNYVYPVDYAHNYLEVDYWLFLNEQLETPIAPLKPYGVYVENLGERYYATISTVRISNLKNASFLLTSSVQTKRDLIKHLGIEEEKISIIPFVYVEPDKTISQCVEDYILIEVDLKKETHVVQLLSDIKEYYRLYNSETKVKINVNSLEKYISDKLIEQYKELIKKSEILNKNVVMYSNLRAIEYNTLYANAKKIIYPHNLSNIFFKISKAVYFSKKIVLNEYPFYKDIEKFLNCKFQYENFNRKDNLLLKIFDESIETTYPETDFNALYQNSIDQISQVWRKLL